MVAALVVEEWAVAEKVEVAPGEAAAVVEEAADRLAEVAVQMAVGMRAEEVLVAAARAVVERAAAASAAVARAAEARVVAA